jgi:hypothetical protein
MPEVDQETVSAASKALEVAGGSIEAAAAALDADTVDQEDVASCGEALSKAREAITDAEKALGIEQAKTVQEMSAAEHAARKYGDT